MGYYRGDHYRRYAGDYYRGDPSFLGGLGRAIGRGVKVLAGTAIGYITGGPKGAIAGAIGGTGEAISQGVTQETLAAGGSESALTPALQAQHKAALLKGPLAMPSLGATGMGLALVPGMHVRRMHPNKSTYVTRGGGTSRWPLGLTVHPKGTEAVPSRRMNVGNARALRRSLRRLSGFAKLAHRVLVIHKRFKKRIGRRGRR